MGLESDPLVRTWLEEGVAWIEINRPDKLNALSRSTLEALRTAVAVLVGDRRSRVLILTGSGDRAFAAGADIAEMSAMDRDQIRGLMELGKEVAALVESAPQPVIACVNGYALGGGCELALAADLIVASEKAQFGLPEVALGVLPGWGGSQRIQRRVGYGRARDMLLTCRRVPASEALSWGLCDRVFPPETLREETRALASTLQRWDPAALTAASQALSRALELPPDQGLALETELFVDLFDRPERAEAMARFLKRDG
jgi:enoyl-CoA hydratase